MLRKILTICAAAAIASATLQATTAPVRAEGFFAKLIQGGKPRIKHHQAVIRNSDESPIPREIVRYDETVPAGTIIVETSERRLYYTLGHGLAMKYAVGVGREGFEWSGEHAITRKAEWPGWTPPAEMIVREARNGKVLPDYMPGGPNNPLGARALYIGETVYRIHGTNQPMTIGKAMSSGCIRMANNDIIDLYEQVEPGTRIIVR